ncbi:hypothetical protein [Chryseobacterium mucoviscidosis]|uniref:hypothetical protein n=1 Tax=Chryseobacterium mucoviscidosis TaxID=1945581 RepID=UPI0031DA9CC2
MRITLLAILLFSASLSAQQKIRKPLIPRTDSVGIYKMDSKTIQPPQKSDQRNLYKMPSAKPKEGTAYSGLKNNKTDHHDYKMLNSIAPEAPKKEEKEKQLPATDK